MSNSFKFNLVLKGILLAAIFAFILSLILGLLLFLTPLPESELNITIIFGISIFISSLITSYLAGTKGIYYGLSIGLGFILLLLLLAAILSNNQPTWFKIAEKMIFALLSGGIGGTIGVLIKR